MVNGWKERGWSGFARFWGYSYTEDAGKAGNWRIMGVYEDGRTQPIQHDMTRQKAYRTAKYAAKTRNSYFIRPEHKYFVGTKWLPWIYKAGEKEWRIIRVSGKPKLAWVKRRK